VKLPNPQFTAIQSHFFELITTKDCLSQKGSYLAHSIILQILNTN